MGRTTLTSIDGTTMIRRPIIKHHVENEDYD